MSLWYFGENGQQVGPVDESWLRGAIGEGRIRQDTQLWREGLTQWQTLAELPELGGAYLPQAYAGGYSGLAIASLICGAIGLISCMILLGIPAVICGHLSIRQMERSPVPVTGRGMALAGLVMGYLQLAIIAGFLLWIIFAFASFQSFIR